MDGKSLRLHHELLLLALHDQKGTLAFGQTIEYGLGGALLTELLLDGHARIVEQQGRWHRKFFVELTTKSLTGDPAMDAAQDKLGAAKRRASPADTVARIAGIGGLWRLVAVDLARKGVLQESEREVLLLFRQRTYPTLDPQPERKLIARIHEALQGSGYLAVRTAALIGLADVTGMLAAMYTWRELKSLRPRILAVRASDLGSRAAREAIEAASAAMAACIAAVAASG